MEKEKLYESNDTQTTENIDAAPESGRQKKKKSRKKEKILKKKSATAPFVLSIISLSLFWLFGLPTVITSIIALVGIKSRRRRGVDSEADEKKLKTAKLLATIALIASVISIILWIFLIAFLLVQIISAALSGIGQAIGTALGTALSQAITEAVSSAADSAVNGSAAVR